MTMTFTQSSLAVVGLEISFGSLSGRDAVKHLLSLHSPGSLPSAGTTPAEALNRRALQSARSDNLPAAFRLSPGRTGLPENLVDAQFLLERGAFCVLLSAEPGAHSNAALALTTPDNAAKNKMQVWAVLEPGSPDDVLPELVAFPQTTPVSSLLKRFSGYPGGGSSSALWPFPPGQEDSPLFPLAAVVLALHHRWLPACPNPDLPGLPPAGPFYAPAESRPWFTPQGIPRRAALFLDEDNLLGVSSAAANEDLPQPAGPPGGPLLAPLAAHSPQELLEHLDAFTSSLSSASSLSWVVREAHTELNPEAPYCLALLARDLDDLRREAAFARQGIPQALEKGADWLTPQGSAFSPQPLGKRGKIALVYPGAFNSYPGAGRELFRLFPFLHRRFEQWTSDPGAALCENLLYPRTGGGLSKEELEKAEERLNHDPITMLSSGASLAIIYTLILQEAFGLQPDAAFGYSLGENSMMFAAGVWTNGEEVRRALQGSPLFHTRLAGHQLAVRQAWGLPLTPAASEEHLWANWVLMAPAEKVREALASEPHVYLTHLNTPRQVVIGGDPAGCQRVISALKCSSLRAPFDYALHCAPIRSELAELQRLHHWPVQRLPAWALWSAAQNCPVEPESGKIAAGIARTLVSPLDFPALIHSVYQDGARIFIETGAGSNCTRWVDETLRDQPHLAASMDRKGSDAYTSLVRMLARLLSHRVPVDTHYVYTQLMD